jgi:hypothetical protein
MFDKKLVQSKVYSSFTLLKLALNFKTLLPEE